MTRISLAWLAAPALSLVSWLAVGCSELPPERCSGHVECECASGEVGSRPCGSADDSACVCTGDASEPMEAGMDGSLVGDGDGDGDGDGMDWPPSGDGDGDHAGDAAVDLTCGVQQSQATISPERPVDVLFAIDTSCSMSEEIAGVKRNINENFASIIDESGADYRVIMLAEFGSASLQVCVEPPLGGAPCAGAVSPVNGPRFFHYDLDVYSTDSVCQLIDGFDGTLPDASGQAPMGWQQWLRPDSLKVFVEVTDDRVSCSTSGLGPAGAHAFNLPNSGNPQADASNLALEIMDAIMALSPDQFVVDNKPNFVWHSLIGIQDNDPPTTPYTARDPARFEGRCAGAVNAAPTYQMMSIFSGGLRYPICAAIDQGGSGYDPVFRAIANQVVRGSGVDCAFPVPAPPEGKFVDLDTVVVDYTPSGGGATETLGRVPQADCDADSFYISMGAIKLCDAACTRVRGDDGAGIRVVFECGDYVDPVLE